MCAAVYTTPKRGNASGGSPPDGGFCLTGEPVGFELAGADGVYHSAKAVLLPGRITLTADGVAAPVAARYAWTNYMEVTVFGRNGLPLAPFRSSAL